LLNPLLKYFFQKNIKPSVILLKDNSASQLVAFKKIDSAKYHQQLNQLIESLSKDYTVKTYSFGTNLRDSLSKTYTDQSTDISSALEQALSSNEYNNVGAVILLSDGIFNQGISPLNSSFPFKGSIYTVGVGDTSLQKDAIVSRLFANKVVFMGDKFSLRADLSAFGAQGEKMNVSVVHKNSGRSLSNQTIQISDNRFSKSIELIIDASGTGLQHYQVQIGALANEQNISNNTQDIYVEVLDNKQAILMIAHAPHPDLYALKEALAKNKNYKVDIALAENAPTDISNYQLIILHNLPSAKYGINNIIEQSKKTQYITLVYSGSTNSPTHVQ
jgi:hypothetical protein